MGLHKTGKGEWQVTYTLDGRQKTVYLGKRYDSRSAAKIESVILDLSNCRYRKSKPSQSLVAKVRNLPANVAESLRRHGLLQQAESRTLGELAAEHEQSKLELKPSSRQFYDIYRRKLLDYFGKDANIAEITPDLCREFIELQRSTQNKYTITSLLKGVGNVFSLAVEKEYVTKNPFKGLAERNEHNEEKEFYVTREMLENAMSLTKLKERRFVLLLARYAGLRIPSEIRFMRFGDFHDDTFVVHEDTKTGKREVPFFHELRETFEILRHKRRDDDFVFSQKVTAPSNMGLYFRRKIYESGFDVCGLGVGVPWPKLFVNLRSSCITDYSRLGYSEKLLNAIFGNSEQVRKKHYIQLRKRNEYRKILDDNAAIIDLLKRHGGSFENDADFEFCIRELFFRKTLVELAAPRPEPGISRIFPN